MFIRPGGWVGGGGGGEREAEAEVMRERLREAWGMKETKDKRGIRDKMARKKIRYSLFFPLVGESCLSSSPPFNRVVS